MSCMSKQYEGGGTPIGVLPCTNFGMRRCREKATVFEIAIRRLARDARLRRAPHVARCGDSFKHTIPVWCRSPLGRDAVRGARGVVVLVFQIFPIPSFLTDACPTRRAVSWSFRRDRPVRSHRVDGLRALRGVCVVGRAGNRRK